MVELWSAPTPDGQKVHVALEELGLRYRLMPFDPASAEPPDPDFAAIPPDWLLPAIRDAEGPEEPVRLCGGSAILLYLAGREGRLMPREPAGRAACLQWLMFETAGIGPVFGQWHHFANHAPEEASYAIGRFGDEVRRLYQALERRLAENEYLAGDGFSIADVATFPWARNPQTRDIDFAEFPSVARWHDAIAARPAVSRGMAVLAAPRGAG